MEDALLLEVQKLTSHLSQMVDKPTDLNRTMNISILNALWGIMVGETLSLTDEKSLDLMKGIEPIIRGEAGNMAAAAMLPSPHMALWPGT